VRFEHESADPRKWIQKPSRRGGVYEVHEQPSVACWEATSIKVTAAASVTADVAERPVGSRQEEDPPIGSALARRAGIFFIDSFQCERVSPPAMRRTATRFARKLFGTKVNEICSVDVP
jgi:hypothetical protein